MPEVTALLLAFDVHKNSQGLLDVQGVLTGIEWSGAGEPPHALPPVWLLAIVKLQEGDPQGDWEARYEWQQGDACLCDFEDLTTDVFESWFAMLLQPPADQLRLRGSGSYRLCMTLRPKGEREWSSVLASTYVDVQITQTGTDVEFMHHLEGEARPDRPQVTYPRDGYYCHYCHTYYGDQPTDVPAVCPSCKGLNYPLSPPAPQ
jgi:hypothetical protein